MSCSTCVCIYMYVHTCTVEFSMPTSQSERSTGVRIDSWEKLCSTTMLVLLACVSSREKIEQTNSKKRKTSNALYAARVLCRDFEQNSPERHKSTHWGTLFVAGGHWKTSKATLKQLALAMSSQKAPTISIFDSLDRQTLKLRAQSSFVPSRHDLRQQTLGGTLLEGRAVCAWIYLEATGEPARRPFMPEKSSYQACQSWEKDRKWSISAAPSYNPSI